MRRKSCKSEYKTSRKRRISSFSIRSFLLFFSFYLPVHYFNLPFTLRSIASCLHFSPPFSQFTYYSPAVTHAIRPYRINIDSSSGINIAVVPYSRSITWDGFGERFECPALLFGTPKRQPSEIRISVFSQVLKKRKCRSRKSNSKRFKWTRN